MKIHCIQHVEFETLGTISEWIEKRKHYLSTTRLHENEYFPKMEDLDLLIIMGGPMNIYEHEKYPWLGEEKKFIKEVISAGKAVIGICLGAQLIADILKAEVFKNDYKEIGWFPVFMSREVGAESPLLGGIPEKFPAFHWHGDTFSLPEGAVQLFRSNACGQQGFIYSDHVMALQFHPEINAKLLYSMIEHERHELVKADFVQEEEDIKKLGEKYLPAQKQFIYSLMDAFVSV